MKNLFKATMVAGALALSSFGISSPAAAQVSFGFSYGSPYYGRPYYGSYGYNRYCRPITTVQYDAFGYAYPVTTYECPRAYRYGVGLGYPYHRYGYRYGGYAAYPRYRW
jgi:hypothetical protein